MPTHPEPAVGVNRCGVRVESGFIAYGCILERGHHHTGEPHYASEVDRSVRAWRTWREAQDRKEAEEVRERTQVAEQVGVMSAPAPEPSPEPAPAPVAEASSPVETAHTDSEIATISRRAVKIRQKDPSLSASLALWLACEQITREQK